jgi:DNA-binding transcriptional LysR family regulator
MTLNSVINSVMKLADLDLNLVVVFDHLMETRSVTATARRLELTQSTVSAALKRLRAVTGDRLIERRGNTMVPTRTALTIWPEIRAALKAIEANLSRLEAFDPASRNAVFRIGLDEYSLTVIGDRLIQAMRRGSPNARIDILPIPPPMADEALNGGQIDLAIGASWTPLAGLRVERLFKEEFVCLVDRHHPVGRTSLTIERYLEFPHLLVSSVGRVTGNVDGALTRLGRQRRVGLTVPYLLAAPALLAGSELILNTGDRLAERLCQWYPVRTVEPPIRIPGFAVAMVWHPRNTASAAHRWLRDQVAGAVR